MKYSINWVVPDFKQEFGEYFENPYTKNFVDTKVRMFENKEELLGFLHKGKLVSITKRELGKINDNMTLKDSDFEKELEEADYRISFDSMEKELIEKGSIILPAPIVLKTFCYYGFSGNRRMNLAFRHKIPLKVWLVKSKYPPIPMGVRKSPIRSTESFCSQADLCKYNVSTSFNHYCDYYKVNLGSLMHGAARRYPICLETDPVWQKWWKKLIALRKKYIIEP